MRQPSREFWSGRKVLLTGHTGFKGAWMVMLLERLGAEVHGFSLPEPVSEPSLFDLAKLDTMCADHRGDITDRAAIRKAVEDAAPSVVIHMAAQPIVRLSYHEPIETFAVNVMGTANVLDACRDRDGLLAVGVVTSDKCYENREHVWPYRESDAMGGHDPYSASKGCSELVASSYARSFFSKGGARVVSLRAGNVIGGGDWAADRLLPDLVRAAKTGQTAEIRNPVSVRPWQHVLDPLSGYLLAIEHAVGRKAWSGFDSWNFGPNPGEELPVRDVVETFREAWEGLPAVAYGVPSEQHEAHLLRVDPTKAKVELNWRPCASNIEAIQSVVAWARAHLDGADVRRQSQDDIARLLGL